MKTKKRKKTETCTKHQCLICKKVKEDGLYTSDGEFICVYCCEWIAKEGKRNGL